MFYANCYIVFSNHKLLVIPRMHILNKQQITLVSHVENSLNKVSSLHFIFDCISTYMYAV